MLHANYLTHTLSASLRSTQQDTRRLTALITFFSIKPAGPPPIHQYPIKSLSAILHRQHQSIVFQFSSNKLQSAESRFVRSDFCKLRCILAIITAQLCKSADGSEQRCQPGPVERPVKISQLSVTR
jgi:hypothetical protein